ncbi:polysaccharide pyruvyl transferase family protein [Streptomyces sp. NPDC058221]|uniref:polysaccharide pyruvyl transferase family protein n=1 Tax=Streptomyces sp. NPDC058221 TaxID=3346388 RepID=UPI0036E3FEB0
MNDGTSGRVFYLVSPAGTPNFGDEIIAEVWLRHLAATAPEAEVVVDCAGVERARRTLGGLHPRSRFTNTLWRLCHQFSGEALQTVAAVEDAIRNPAGWSADGVRDLLRADVVHMVGGGYVNAIWPSLVALMAGVSTAAGLSGSRAAMTGQGLYPLPPGLEQLVTDLAGSFALADARDAPTARLLGADRSHTTGDDAFLGGGASRDPSGEEAPEVMVSLQSHLAGVPAERLVDFVGRTVDAWGVSTVGLLECAPAFDAEVLALAERRLGAPRIYRVDEALTSGLPTSPEQCWISSRFHPHLIAAAGGASGVALTMESDYYAVKHGSLRDWGSRWTLLTDLDAVPERPRDGGFPAEDVERLRKGKQVLAAEVYGG